MLRPIHLPGFFITATDTEVGKTVIAAAIAKWFAARGHRVGVLKPAATGCRREREGLISEDAELLAHCADSPFPLDVICPQRFAEPLAPAIAARRANTRLDWSAIQYSIDLISASSDFLLVEGVGGVMVPMDEKTLVRDMMRWLGLPAIVVSRPGLGTINHTLLTIEALKSAGIDIAGIIINRHPTDTPGVAVETNPPAIEHWCGCPILAIVPDERFVAPHLAPGIEMAIQPVNWAGLAW